MLLIFIISALILHSKLFIETYFNEFTIILIYFNQKISLLKQIFAIQIQTFYNIPFFFIKYLWVSNIAATTIALLATVILLYFSSPKKYENFLKCVTNQDGNFCLLLFLKIKCKLLHHAWNITFPYFLFWLVLN